MYLLFVGRGGLVAVSTMQRGNLPNGAKPGRSIMPK